MNYYGVQILRDYGYIIKNCRKFYLDGYKLNNNLIYLKIFYIYLNLIYFHFIYKLNVDCVDCVDCVD